MLVSFNVVVDQHQLIDAQKNVNKLISQFNGLARAAQFALAVLGVGKLTETVDQYINIENKLKAVTDSTEEFVAAQRGVTRIADELMQPVNDITDTFLRYTLATESLGASQEDVLDFTKRVTQAMILSGATSEEVHRAAVQLAQGFGKNFKAAAQDLKSVKEQAPVLARIIEKAAGAAPGSLLVAAKAGKVTSKLVFDSVRAAGEELDREFAQRQMRFEDISNLLGNQLMRLMKLLKPLFVPVIAWLERVVRAIGDWVEDGSAMNAVIAGAIMAVVALTYALAPLAMAAAAAAAPFVAMFLALDELVAFMRGDESYIEDWLTKAFGAEKMEKARAALNELLETAKKWVAALTGDGPELEMAAWRMRRAFSNALKGAWDEFIEYAYTHDNFISAIVRWSTARKGTKAEDKSVWQMTPGEFFGGAAGRSDPYRQRYEAEHPEERTPTLGPTIPIPTVPQNWEPVGALPPSFRNPYGGYNNPNMSPVINNTITVQGNADAPVAREIASRAGTATAEALGRDRSAVGASFGVQP